MYLAPPARPPSLFLSEEARSKRGASEASAKPGYHKCSLRKEASNLTASVPRMGRLFCSVSLWFRGHMLHIGWLIHDPFFIERPPFTIKPAISGSPNGGRAGWR